METKQIEVDCPQCQERIVVDVRTGKVLKHFPKGEVDETGKPVLDESRWDAAAGKVAGRKGTGAEVFDSALDKERNRERDLDDLFQKAQDKIAKRKRDLEQEP